MPVFLSVTQLNLRMEQPQLSYMFQKLPSQQPASVANVLVYKIHTPSRLLYKVHQLHKYMAILSDSISGLGQ
jgi:hypothetical protein